MARTLPAFFKLKHKNTMKYYPSNGSEGDWFEGRFCNKCYKKSNCTILRNAYLGKYPKQWIYNENKEPTCTSYNPIKPTKKVIKDSLPTLF